MTTPTRKQWCKKIVHTGLRMDIGGRRCGNPAKPGSDFCGVHQDRPAADLTPQPAASEPEVGVSQSTTITAVLRWPMGDGPVVQVPYQARMGFITTVVGRVTDGRDPVVEVRGVLRKKDGTPGEQTWDDRYRGERLLDQDTLELLTRTLANEAEA